MSILTFPGGQVVDVQFDEQAHTYVVAHKLADGKFSDFRPTHGITTPLAVVPKDYLKTWAGKEAVLATLERVREQPKLVKDLDKFFADFELKENETRDKDGSKLMTDYRFKKQYPWYTGLSTASKRKSKESTDVGTWIHGAIEQYYKSGRKTLPVITPASQPIWDSFIMFDNLFKPQPDDDGLEFIVYSLMFGYSGQGDFKGVMSGKHCIGDWKSTNRSYQNPNGISVEYFFQVGGLAQAEFERTGIWVDDLFIANFDKKGDEPKVIWASDFGMSPQDCARAYVSCFNNYHTIKDWEYKFLKK
jgi:hypothetical protein